MSLEELEQELGPRLRRAFDEVLGERGGEDLDLVVDGAHGTASGTSRRASRRALTAAAVVLSVALVASLGLLLRRGDGAMPADDGAVTTVTATTAAATVRDPLPAATFPPGDGRAQTFLVVGVDGRPCGDATAGTRDPSTGDGDLRTDTVLLVRADPAAGRAALLSLPRDLWVPIAGTDRSDRITAAFDAGNPSRLVQTVMAVFGVAIDHYVEVDFCSFTKVVDRLGGVPVPFDRPTRDQRTGLSVPAGCAVMDGREALAYVRSRYLEYDDGTGFRADPSGDYGRIARLQDFLGRVFARARAAGLGDPLEATGLVDDVLRSLRVDQRLTLDGLLGLAGELGSLDRERARVGTITGDPADRNGAMVIVADPAAAPNADLLAPFRDGGWPEGQPAPVAGVVPSAGTACG